LQPIAQLGEIGLSAGSGVGENERYHNDLLVAELAQAKLRTSGVFEGEVGRQLADAGTVHLGKVVVREGLPPFRFSKKPQRILCQSASGCGPLGVFLCRLLQEGDGGRTGARKPDKGFHLQFPAWIPEVWFVGVPLPLFIEAVQDITSRLPFVFFVLGLLALEDEEYPAVRSGAGEFRGPIL